MSVNFLSLIFTPLSSSRCYRLWPCICVYPAVLSSDLIFFPCWVYFQRFWVVLCREFKETLTLFQTCVKFYWYPTCVFPTSENWFVHLYSTTTYTWAQLTRIASIYRNIWQEGSHSLISVVLTWLLLACFAVNWHLPSIWILFINKLIICMESTFN